MQRIAFIGAGIMGKSMVRNLKKAGFTVQIYARHPEKVAELVQEGIELFSTIGDCVKEADAVITIVGFPSDVEEVYFGSGNILDSAKKGACLIDMTTTSPELDKRIYEEGKKRGLHVLDAPVTGGDTGAKNGTLSILVGGDREDFESCQKIFEAMGKNIKYFGPSGSGQHAKAVNQIMVAANLAGVCEAYTYAKAYGLNLETITDALADGAAGSWQLKGNGPKMIQGDTAPGFFIKHFVKDLKIVEEGAKEKDLDLPVAKTVLRENEALEQAGMGDFGTQALLRYYEGGKEKLV